MYHEIDDEPRLFGNETIVLITLVSRPWKWSQVQMKYAWLACTHIINVWTKHGQPRFYGNGDLIMKNITQI
jgi:hypothetical protein